MEIGYSKIYSAGTLTRALVANDFNNDGAADLAIIDEGTSTLRIRLGNSNAGVSALQSFSLRTKQDSNEAMNYLTGAFNRISQQRGQIGAFQSRVDVAVNV